MDLQKEKIKIEKKIKELDIQIKIEEEKRDNMFLNFFKLKKSECCGSFDGIHKSNCLFLAKI